MLFFCATQMVYNDIEFIFQIGIRSQFAGIRISTTLRRFNKSNTHIKISSLVCSEKNQDTKKTRMFLRYQNKMVLVLSVKLLKPVGDIIKTVKVVTMLRIAQESQAVTVVLLLKILLIYLMKLQRKLTRLYKNMEFIKKK